MVYFEFWTYKSYQHSKIRISSGTKYGLRMFSIDFYINPLPFCTKDVGLGPSWAWRSSWSSTSRGVLRLQLFAELGSKKDWNLIESIGIYGNMIGIFNYRNIYIDEMVVFCFLDIRFYDGFLCSNAEIGSILQVFFCSFFCFWLQCQILADWPTVCWGAIRCLLSSMTCACAMLNDLHETLTKGSIVGRDWTILDNHMDTKYCTYWTHLTQNFLPGWVLVESWLTLGRALSGEENKAECVASSNQT